MEFRKPAELIADPDRFQYRRNADGDDGTVRALPEEEFDPERCKALVGWRDPADGREFVVDGHHRRAWAERDGADEVPVRFLDAPTADAAREYGRRLNEAFALTATFSAPGSPPRPGLVWNEGTHRWRNPETNEEHDHAPAAPAAPTGAPAPSAVGGDVWRKKLPPAESVTARPKTKRARDELAKAVQSAWTEARNALVAKYGTRDINDRMSPEEVEAENRVFAALRPLASGNEHDGPHDLGPISDARYAGYYRGAVQALDALRGEPAPVPTPAPAPDPEPAPAPKPPKAPQIPPAPAAAALAKKPLADKKLLKRFIDSAPTPKAKELLEDAEWNMGPETVADRWGAEHAGTAVRRHTVDQLGASWRVAHEQGLTAEAAYLATVLEHYGARPDESGAGAEVPFDPTRYASAAPTSTGVRVTVARPALVLPESTGEYVVEKGTVAPAPAGGRTFGSEHKDGEEWETGGRRYKRVAGETVRIGGEDDPKGDAGAAKSDPPAPADTSAPTAQAGPKSPPPGAELEAAKLGKTLHSNVQIRHHAGGDWVVKGRHGKLAAVQNEVAVSGLAALAGADVLPVHHVKMYGQDHLAAPLVEGTDLTKLSGGERRAALAQVPKEQVDTHTLFDYVIGSTDPNHGNYLIKPDGGMLAIDKEQSLSMGAGDRTGGIPPPYFLGDLVAEGKAAVDYVLDRNAVGTMADAAGKMAEQLEATGRNKDAVGVRNRAAVLKQLAGGGAEPTVGELMRLGAAADDEARAKTGAVKKFFQSIFGGGR